MTHHSPAAHLIKVALGDQLFKGKSCIGCHGTDKLGSRIGSNPTTGKELWNNGCVEGIPNTVPRPVPTLNEHTGAMPRKGGAQLLQTERAAVAELCLGLSPPSDP